MAHSRCDCLLLSLGIFHAHCAANDVRAGTLQPETFFTAAHLLDRYLASGAPVSRHTLQLMSAAALWVASKLCETGDRELQAADMLKVRPL